MYFNEYVIRICSPIHAPIKQQEVKSDLKPQVKLGFKPVAKEIMTNPKKYLKSFRKNISSLKGANCCITSSVQHKQLRPTTVLKRKATMPWSTGPSFS